MTVYIPGPLRSYTEQKSQVEAFGATLDELITELDCRYSGLRFRIVNEQDAIREHIKLFVNQELAPNLDVPLKSTDVVHIICALSGG
jgi:molybdopterin converting factor small subunit